MSESSEITHFEVTVKKGEHGETIDVIDIDATSEPDAHRKAKQRDDVYDVMTGCTTEYRLDENGGKVY
ncbi:hypothetical protein [Natrinema versiforme]|uniref:Uncharacterized protein n=1 Tax=Natrinema versiforme JCM 10478 TaxID=1227496 RepID=L9Y5E8_9EURY|nr:hypothetical protein [Natrinema versiforme]ELY68881.1 hypothetical protein C489_05928 [Natrinema versiforme JCM 10478]